jgi:hypothetical protein
MQDLFRYWGEPQLDPQITPQVLQQRVHRNISTIGESRQDLLNQLNLAGSAKQLDVGNRRFQLRKVDLVATAGTRFQTSVCLD